MAQIIWKTQEELDNEKLVTAREAKNAELEAACVAAIAEGFTSESTTYEFTFGEQNQKDFTHYSIMMLCSGEGCTRQFTLKTKSGGIETLTPEQFKTVVLEAEEHKISKREQLLALQLQVNTAETIEAVNAIVWS